MRLFHPMAAVATIESHSPPVRHTWMADLSLLLVAIIWGVNIPVMKIALAMKISPFSLNAVRLVVSALVLLAFAARERRGGVRPLAELSKWRILVYAIVVSVAYQLFFLIAVSLTSSADIALIMATVPMWTALSARVFLKEMLPGLAWTGLLIAFAGTMIVTLQGQAPAVTTASSPDLRDSAILQTPAIGTIQTPRPADSPSAISEARSRFTGNMIALLAALTWAGGTVFSRPLLKTISPTQLSASATIIGLPFHLLIAWPTLEPDLPLLREIPLQLCILYSGVLSTGLALAMWSFGVKHAGAAQATTFQYLSPVVAIVTAWLWRGETVVLPQIAGGAMIIGGLIVMRTGRRPV